MDPKDLLYTNQFRKTQSITQRELQENANNFIPYRTLKANSVNNVRDDLERTVFTDNPIVDRELKAYGWGRGGIANQQPVLSNFTRDIAESTYYRYRTSYLNIDSRMRDVALYPRPNNYKMFLGRKFDNIESIKLIDYFFPDMQYPINQNNNTLVWFTIPYEMLTLFTDGSPPYELQTGSYTIINWVTNYNKFIEFYKSCKRNVKLFRNRIANCMYYIEVTPGYYTTEELEKEIELQWRQRLFFCSDLFGLLSSEYTPNNEYEYIAPPDSPTAEFIGKPQLVNVKIDPVTSEVSFKLRYEEFSIDWMKSYINKNYIDVRIKSEDPLVASEEYTILANNTLYPLLLTGFPAIGGINSIIINQEYIPKNFAEYFIVELEITPIYYDIVKDPNTGIPIPNIIRLYFYDYALFRPILCSSTDVYKLDDPCSKICDARLGREAPFFFIKGTESSLISYLQSIQNDAAIWFPDKCEPECPQPECEGLDPTSEGYLKDCYCEIFPAPLFSDILNPILINKDCSNRLLTQVLGFLDTNNSLAQIGPNFFSFAINNNIIYRASSYNNTVQTANIALQQANNYEKCRTDAGRKQNLVAIDYVTNSLFLDFKLPICKNQDGTYSFYTTNYMFLKILNPVLANQISSSQIMQVRSTSNFANGSNAEYEYLNDSVDGITIQDCEVGIYPCPGKICFDKLPSLYPEKTAGIATLTKDVDNLFAKIKFSTNAGACNPDNPFTNEVIYFEGNVNNLDEFVIQLVDFEGKILQTNGEHCFTLMIVEKIEVLKDTNINTRTGYVNSSGSDNVLRNNYASR